MIVDSALYRGGERVTVDCEKEDLERLRDEATGDEDFVWVGLHHPDDAELQFVAKVFGLHPLAVEDAGEAHQRRTADKLGGSWHELDTGHYPMLSMPGELTQILLAV